MKLGDLRKGSAAFSQRADLTRVFTYLSGVLLDLPGLFRALPQQKLDGLR
jgi:hypothetical protein